MRVVLEEDVGDLKSTEAHQNGRVRNCLMVQWSGLRTCTAKSLRSILSQKTNIPYYTAQPEKKKKGPKDMGRALTVSVAEGEIS